MINRTTAALAASVVSVIGGTAAGQNITSVQVLTGLSRPIWLGAPKGLYNRVFVAEQRGSGGVGNQARVKMYALNPVSGALTFVSDFITLSPVSTGSEQGLLGVAFHPQYLTNGKVYLHFSNQSSAGATTIREYIANGTPATATTASPSAQDVIFSVAQPFSNHNGGWMDFGPDGFLYLALGDGGSANDPGNRAQNTFNLLGKTLRFDVDGDDFPADPARDYRIPAGNPFASGVSGAPEVYSYGLRNHWRNDIDPTNGDHYIADVGQNAREEVNILPLANANGMNFGWRCLEGTLNTGLCGTIPSGTHVPLLQYDHSSGIAPTFLTGCSITGGMVYRGCAIPDLAGTYFFADVCSNWIFSVRANSGTNTFTNPLNQSSALASAVSAGSIVSWGRDAYGELYICSLNGSIHKIVRTGGTAPADCNANGRPDCQEILDGSVADANSNAVPDVCEAPFAFNLSSPADGATGVPVNPTLTWAASPNAVTYNVAVATDAGLTNVVASTTGVAGTSWNVSPSLNQGVTYFWGVRAVNPNGNTASNPVSWSFTTIAPPSCPGDLDGNGQRNVADLTILLGAFGTCPGDGGYVPAAGTIDPGNPCVNTGDLVVFLGNFGVPCP